LDAGLEVDSLHVCRELEVLATQDAAKQIVRKAGLHPDGIDVDNAVLHRYTRNGTFDRILVAIAHLVRFGQCNRCVETFGLCQQIILSAPASHVGQWAR